jgi:DNA topoisomerase-3
MKRFVGPLAGFRSRMGRPFAAGVRLTDDLRVEFDFGQLRAEDEQAAPDFSGQDPLGACPKCGAHVFEHGAVYLCEKSVGADRSCDFRSGKMILQQPVEADQMRKLLATGRTDLLTRFVSKKGRRFKAYLAKTAENRIGFEFEARPARAAAAPAASRPGPSHATPATPAPRPRARAAKVTARVKPAPAKAARKKKGKVA